MMECSQLNHYVEVEKTYAQQGLSIKNTFLTFEDSDEKKEFDMDESSLSAPGKLVTLLLDDSVVSLRSNKLSTVAEEFSSVELSKPVLDDNTSGGYNRGEDAKHFAEGYALQGQMVKVKNTFLTIDEDIIKMDESILSAPARLNHLGLDDSLRSLHQSSAAGVTHVDQACLHPVAEKENCEPAVTTMHIRNIPNRCTKEEVLDHINKLGFEGQYDLFHMPLDKKARSNLGFAFINFMEAEAAAKFQQSLKGTSVSGSRVPNSKKTCTCAPANVQGIDNYIKHLVDARKRQEELVLAQKQGEENKSTKISL
eukprot:gnl/MRDRNA2_/MRDRNA2_86274_c0_seq2.p1 gnl/MRDRNA2_/MRDRNA2_86274_c0~~gnl/MRDRNA2_/MRDRNA2_86274_c0_seq2.p1  ORF type:complete len:310 (+),score=77.73 gnl/MRDRNA2_/MRDRNA2_86274_c0_seq2:76-1005(+)